MGRFYLHSLRVATWVSCLLMVALPWSCDLFTPAAVLLLALVQSLRAANTSVCGRPGGRWLAVRLWGPLMLENAIYGCWLGLQPLYVSALLLTVAGAYASLLRLGAAVWIVWGAASCFLPQPWAGLETLLVFLLLSRRCPWPQPRASKGLHPAVVVSLAALVACGTQQHWQRREHSRLQVCLSTVGKVVGDALEMYAADHAGHYPLRPAQLVPDYLRRLPSCPAATHLAAYQIMMADKVYTIVCTGRHAGLPVGWPQYRSSTGLDPGR